MMDWRVLHAMLRRDYPGAKVMVTEASEVPAGGGKRVVFGLRAVVEMGTLHKILTAEEIARYEGQRETLKRNYTGWYQDQGRKRQA